MLTTSGSDLSSVGSPAGTLSVTLDTKGRVRTSPEQRGVILAEFERSGLSAAQFAKRTGLKYSTFALWVQRHRRLTQRSAPQSVQLLEAVVAPAPSAALQVQLPGGARLEIREAGQISLAVALLHALEQSC